MELSENHKRTYLANLNYLRITCPDLYERVTCADASDPPVLEVTRDGHLTLKKDGIYMESRFAPERNALSYLRNEPGAEATVLFLGSGLGYHINALLRRGKFRSILVERDLGVFKAALYILKPALFSRIQLLVGMEQEAVHELLRRLPLEKLAVIKHPPSTQLNRRYYEAVEGGILGRLKGALASSVTERASHRLWVRNILKNLASLKGRVRGTAECAGRFSGPVVLVASGPFLEDAAGLLKRLRVELPLFALLPSYPFLHKEGIEPDLLVTTDAGFWNRLRLSGGVRVPLLSTWSAESVLLRNWAGELSLFSHGLPLEEELEMLSKHSLVIPMQGTASAVMIKLARAMGFGTIYLAGFDFAFRGMKDHHAGAGFDDYLLGAASRLCTWHTQVAARFRREPCKPVDAQSGGRISSSHKLLLYRDWVERELAGGDLFRITDGAAMNGVCPLSGKAEDLASKFRGARYRKRFAEGMDASAKSPVPESVAEEEMRRLLAKFEKVDLPSAYRFFFGEPPPGMPMGEIEQDTAWAVAELRKRFGKGLYSGGPVGGPCGGTGSRGGEKPMSDIPTGG